MSRVEAGLELAGELLSEMVEAVAIGALSILTHES